MFMVRCLSLHSRRVSATSGPSTRGERGAVIVSCQLRTRKGRMRVRGRFERTSLGQLLYTAELPPSTRSDGMQGQSLNPTILSLEDSLLWGCASCYQNIRRAVLLGHSNEEKGREKICYTNTTKLCVSIEVRTKCAKRNPVRNKNPLPPTKINTAQSP